MLSTVGLVIFIWLPALIVITRNIAHHTYMWQIKEYRLDRIISQLKYGEERSLKGNWLNLIQIILLFGTIIFFLQPTNWLLIVPALTLISYTYEALKSIDEIILRKFIWPKKSIRNLLIVSFSFITLLLPIILPINFIRNVYKDPEFKSETIKVELQRVEIEDFLIQKRVGESDAQGISLAIAVIVITSALILASDLAAPFITSFFAVTTEPLAQYKRSKMIRNAKSKVEKHSKFKVVGITGSFGKTTTKELLYYLIKDNFKTTITKKNYNSTVGIAQSVLQNLKPETEVFIAEMGAYRKGEILNSTKILEPDISIVTGLGNQHISLFGSIEKLFAAKYEIIEELNSDGLAIFNGSNRLSLRMAAKTKQRNLTYKTIEKKGGYSQNLDKSNDYLEKAPIQGKLYAKNLEKYDHGFKFDLVYKTANYPIKIKLQGKHNIENLLAAVAAALELGMNFKDIAAKLNTSEPPQIYLRTFNGYNEALIIDDSYNSNAIGFKKALTELQDTHGKRKIVISKGIIELGKERDKVYQQIASNFEGVDILFTTDQKLSDRINTKGTKVLLVKDNFELINKVLKEIKEKDIVLLEGTLPEKLVNTLIEPNNS